VGEEVRIEVGEEVEQWKWADGSGRESEMW
jgi:hypothetical protein